MASVKISFESRAHEGGVLNCKLPVMGVAAVALLVIGSLAVAGIVPASALGGTAIGLGAATFIATVMKPQTDCKHRTLLLLASAVIVTLGALGTAGVLSGAQAGWGLVGTSIPFVAQFLWDGRRGDCCQGGRSERRALFHDFNEDGGTARILMPANQFGGNQAQGGGRQPRLVQQHSDLVDD